MQSAEWIADSDHIHNVGEVHEPPVLWRYTGSIVQRFTTNPNGERKPPLCKGGKKSDRTSGGIVNPRSSTHINSAKTDFQPKRYDIPRYLRISEIYVSAISLGGQPFFRIYPISIAGFGLFSSEMNGIAVKSLPFSSSQIMPEQRV